MKKVLIIVFAVLSLYVIYKINHPKVEETFYIEEFSLEDYNIFYLDVSNEVVTTNNLTKIIKNMDIVSIKPYVNPIYKDKLDLEYSFMNNISLKKNIKNFIEYYKKKIKEKGFNDDLSYIDKDGIKIMEVTVYAKGVDIIKIIKDTNIKYKTVSYGEFEYLEI